MDGHPDPTIGPQVYLGPIKRGHIAPETNLIFEEEDKVKPATSSHGVKTHIS